MSKVEKGDTVKIHYIGTFDDGTQFDNSRERELPISFEAGSETLLPAFETAVYGMKVGEVKNIHLTPEDAYGTPRPELVQPVPSSAFPNDYKFQAGAIVEGQGPQGQRLMARIESVDGETVVLDYNHPMAGKNLNFEIEVVGKD